MAVGPVEVPERPEVIESTWAPLRTNWVEDTFEIDTWALLSFGKDRVGRMS